jgi:hypothetical protein
LLDEPRPGVPRTITDARVKRVLTTTLESTPPGNALVDAQPGAAMRHAPDGHRAHLEGLCVAARSGGVLQPREGWSFKFGPQICPIVE